MCDDEAAQYNDAPRNQSTLTGCVSRVWHKGKTVFLLSMTADALPVEVIVFHIDVMTIYLNKMIIFKTVGKKVLICPLIEPQLAKSPYFLFGIESRGDQQRDLLYIRMAWRARQFASVVLDASAAKWCLFPSATTSTPQE
ncbi:MAG: hypothetical protein ACRAUW_08695 [Aeromonas sp.]|uniref:hypothetical protein n=1 Tax=Aeromonas sp. TaxID=647 RepID=UPI003D6B1091